MIGTRSLSDFAEQVNTAYNVLEAIADVESALVAYATTLEERVLLAETVESYREAEQLARERYAAGVDDLQTLLSIERESLAAAQRLAAVEGQVASNAVGLYKALGGAWEIDPEADSQASETTAATKESTTEVRG